MSALFLPVSAVLQVSNGGDLAAAKAVAVSGQTIYVGAGSYAVTASLAKNGVHWVFAPGAVVTLNEDEGVQGIWDDGGAAMVYNVTGAGKFVRTSANGDATPTLVKVSHASSVVYLEGLDLQTNGSTGGVGITQSAGALMVRCRDVLTAGEFGSGIEWTNGKLDVNGRRLYAADYRAHWSGCNSVPTGDADIRFSEIEAGIDAVSDESTNATAATWVRANRIKTTSGSAVWQGGASRLYVEAQKYFGDFYLSAAGLLYVRGDKVTAVYNGNGGAGAALMIVNGSGVADIGINHWDPNSKTGVMFAFSGTAVTYLIGGRFAAGASMNGIALSGGTLELKGMRVDTTGNNASNPVTITSGGALRLTSGTRLLSQGARKSIANGDAGTYTVDGYGGYANNAADTGVTANGLTVSANVT